METVHDSILPEALEVTECAPTPTQNDYNCMTAIQQHTEKV